MDFGLPESALPGPEAAWYASPEFNLNGSARFELANFIDGKNTVSEIRNALSAEFGPKDLKAISHYIEDLVKVGVVKWK